MGDPGEGVRVASIQLQSVLKLLYGEIMFASAVMEAPKVTKTAGM